MSKHPILDIYQAALDGKTVEPYSAAPCAFCSVPARNKGMRTDPPTVERLCLDHTNRLAHRYTEVRPLPEWRAWCIYLERLSSTAPGEEPPALHV